jgi:hypothetical protein
MGTVVDISRNAQRKAFARRFAPGLLRPFTGLTLPIRIGEIAQTALSRWPIKPLPPKAESGIHYLTIGGRSHWLMLRESLFSLYWSWKNLPTVTVVSDGSWSASDFYPVFSWWPGKINVLSPEQIIAQAKAAGERELAQYAEASAWGLKLAAVVLSARRAPVLFVDADILWFKNPALLLGDPASWAKPRALQENYCYQRRDMALRYCAQALEPPFVNAGIVALHGELMPPELLRSMVQEALRDPQDGSCEQTIFATGTKLAGEFFPEKLSLVAFDDTHRLFIRNAKREGYYSRHYVLPARQLIYRDALNLRLDLFRLMTGRGQNGDIC